MFGVGIWPIGERCSSPHQFRLAPTGHLAKGCVHIGDAALQIERSHASKDGVFHGPTKAGFRQQGLLGLQPASAMPPVGDQHPGSHGAERRNQPKQRTVNQPKRSAVGLAPHHQPIANRRHWYLVGVRWTGPWHEAGGRTARRWPRAGQELAPRVMQRDGIPCRYLTWHAVAKQAVDRVIDKYNAQKSGSVAQWYVELQHGWVFKGLADLGINRLLLAARLVETVFPLRRPQCAADGAQLGC